MRQSVKGEMTKARKKDTFSIVALHCSHTCLQRFWGPRNAEFISYT